MNTVQKNTATASFTDDNRNFVKVSGAKTMDEAVTAADAFLDEHGMCVKDGGKFYGDQTEIESDGVVNFNVG